MALTAAERMAVTRARRRGEMAAAPTCKVCGVPIKNSGSRGIKDGRAFMEGKCYNCWKGTPEEKEYTREKRKQKRDKGKEPTMFRYFACWPDSDTPDFGPFNRMRLAVSTAYGGKNKPRGKLWIVWSDNKVTEHENVKQAMIGKSSIDPETGEPGLEGHEWRYHGKIVDGYDKSPYNLIDSARNNPPIEVRIKWHGIGQEVLLNDR